MALDLALQTVFKSSQEPVQNIVFQYLKAKPAEMAPEPAGSGAEPARTGTGTSLEKAKTGHGGPMGHG